MKFDHNITVSEIIGRKFCINPPVVLRWMTKKGYTYQDFGKIIEATKNFEKFLSGILEGVSKE